MVRASVTHSACFNRS